MSSERGYSGKRQMANGICQKRVQERWPAAGRKNSRGKAIHDPSGVALAAIDAFIHPASIDARGLAWAWPLSRGGRERSTREEEQRCENEADQGI